MSKLAFCIFMNNEAADHLQNKIPCVCVIGIDSCILTRILLFGSILAHLSRRLIGELIGYSWSGVRPSSVVVRPSSFTMLKDLLL